MWLVMSLQLGSERLDLICGSDVGRMWIPFSNGLISGWSLGSWVIEKREGNIESVASAMIMDIVGYINNLCYITVLVVM